MPAALRFCRQPGSFTKTIDIPKLPDIGFVSLLKYMNLGVSL